MRKAIVVDIDHTISDSFWRDPMIGGPWDDYHLASEGDLPIKEIATLVNDLHDKFDIVALTARPAKWRGLTMQWMVKHGINVDVILMRADDNYRPAPELKLELARQHFGDDFAEKIELMLDDRDDVAAAFRAEGVTVLQVHAKRSAA